MPDLVKALYMINDVFLEVWSDVGHEYRQGQVQGGDSVLVLGLHRIPECIHAPSPYLSTTVVINVFGFEAEYLIMQSSWAASSHGSHKMQQGPAPRAHAHGRELTVERSDIHKASFTHVFKPLIIIIIIIKNNPDFKSHTVPDLCSVPAPWNLE